MYSRSKCRNSRTRGRLISIRRKDGQKGSILIEFTLVVPFLVLLIFGILDIGMVLLNYMMLQQAAREGVRTAGRMAEFNGAPDSTHTSDGAPHTVCNMITCGIPGPSVCVIGSLPAPICEHVPIHARVREIIVFQGLLNMDAHLITIGSAYDADVAGFTSAEEDTVSIVLAGRYKGFLWRPILRTNYQGPFMFQRNGA